MPASIDLVSSLIALSYKKVSGRFLAWRCSGLSNQCIGLPDFLRRLLQSSLRGVNLPIATVNVVLHVPHIVEFESPAALLARVGFLVLGLERFVVHFWAGTQLILGVCEQVVGAVADQIGPADL